IDSGLERTVVRNAGGEAPLWFHDSKALLEYDGATRTFRRLDVATGQRQGILTLDFSPLGEFTNDMAVLSLDDKFLYVSQKGGGGTDIARQAIVVFDLGRRQRDRSFPLPTNFPIVSRMVLSPDG